MSLLSLMCVSDLHDPHYYDSKYDIEINYCKKVLLQYHIFHDSFPDEYDTFTAPDLLFGSVSDPYTYYVKPEKADSVWHSYISYNYEIGIGIAIDTQNSQFIISDIIPNAHAENILFENDRIIGINENMDVSKLNLESVRTYLTGSANDSITLHIERNANVFEFKLIYKKYKKRSVYTKSISINPYVNIAFIQIESFSDSTCMPGGTKIEFRHALNKTSWAHHTILDLRGNRGGSIDQCMSVISDFVPISKQLFNVSQRVYDTISGTVHTMDSVWRVKEFSMLGQNRKFYVLMDDNSIGETELLILSLHLHRNDIISIGKRSGGKASIQTRFPTVKGGIAVITSGLITPLAGPSFATIGIDPKLTTSHALEAAIILIEGNYPKLH